MAEIVTIGFNGIRITKPSKLNRENKGKNLIVFPANYTVIDIETTGLDPSFDDIIEVAALKVSNGVVISTYETLVKPRDLEIDDFIEDLTGISSEMLLNAPSFTDVANDFLSFVGDDILIGHNVNFDINFLYDATCGRLVNSFVDTMRIARRLLPELKHHRLSDIAEHYKISIDVSHRALSDCKTTNSCYIALSSDALNKFGSYDEYTKSVRNSHAGANANNLTTEKTIFDETHPLYSKNCVFTGVLERFPRKDAMQIVTDLGGICQNSITTKTNYLILGNNDYCPNIKDGKSSKHKKAEYLKLGGQDIDIISENVFYDMIFDN